MYTPVLLLISLTLLMSCGDTKPEKKESISQIKTSLINEEVVETEEIKDVEYCLNAPRIDSICRAKADSVQSVWEGYDMIPPNMYSKLSDAEINQLSVEEKFVYCTQYPEVFSQNCGMYSSWAGDSGCVYLDYIPMIVPIKKFSKRQDSILMITLKQTRKHIATCLSQGSPVSVRMRELGSKFHVKELLPYLIKRYENTKDLKDLSCIVLEIKGTDMFKQQGLGQKFSRFNRSDFKHAYFSVELEKQILDVAQMCVKP